MSKTSLQLVNMVLTNLREAQVTDFSATYTQLVLSFLNKAKAKVEDSWRWRSLVSEVRFTTVAQQVQYFVDAVANAPAVTLAVGSAYPSERSYPIRDSKNNWQAFDITQASSLTIYRLAKVPRENILLDNFQAAAQSTNIPFKFAYTIEAGRPVIYLSNPPPVGRLLAFRLVVPSVEWSVGTETTLIPWRSMVSFATGYAMQERGEELGSNADLYLSSAANELVEEQLGDAEDSYDQLQVDEQ